MKSDIESPRPDYSPGTKTFLQMVNEHDSCQKTRLRRRLQASGFRLQERSGFQSDDPMNAECMGNATERVLIRKGLPGRTIRSVLASLKM
jgi:hypothetical protein